MADNSSRCSLPNCDAELQQPAPDGSLRLYCSQVHRAQARRMRAQTRSQPAAQAWNEPVVAPDFADAVSAALDNALNEVESGRSGRYDTAVQAPKPVMVPEPARSSMPSKTPTSHSAGKPRATRAKVKSPSAAQAMVARTKMRWQHRAKRQLAVGHSLSAFWSVRRSVAACMIAALGAGAVYSVTNGPTPGERKELVVQRQGAGPATVPPSTPPIRTDVVKWVAQTEPVVAEVRQRLEKINTAVKAWNSKSQRWRAQHETLPPVKELLAYKDTLEKQLAQMVTNLSAYQSLQEGRPALSDIARQLGGVEQTLRDNPGVNAGPAAEVARGGLVKQRDMLKEQLATRNQELKRWEEGVQAAMVAPLPQPPIVEPVVEQVVAMTTQPEPPAPVDQEQLALRPDRGAPSSTPNGATTSAPPTDAYLAAQPVERVLERVAEPVLEPVERVLEPVRQVADPATQQVLEPVRQVLQPAERLLPQVVQPVQRILPQLIQQGLEQQRQRNAGQGQANQGQAVLPEQEPQMVAPQAVAPQRARSRQMGSRQDIDPAAAVQPQPAAPRAGQAAPRVQQQARQAQQRVAEVMGSLRESLPQALAPLQKIAPDVIDQVYRSLAQTPVSSSNVAQQSNKKSTKSSTSSNKFSKRSTGNNHLTNAINNGVRKNAAMRGVISGDLGSLSTTINNQVQSALAARLSQNESFKNVSDKGKNPVTKAVQKLQHNSSRNNINNI